MAIKVERRMTKRSAKAGRRGAHRKPAAAQSWLPKAVGTLQRLAAGAALVTVSWGLFSAYQWFATLPVERVMFAGELRQTHQERLVKVVQPLLQSGYFALDLSAIQGVLEQELWVYRATVQRVWPMQLRIDIQEQVPIARWGRDALINHRGERFPVVVPDADRLPLLSGPDGSERLLIETYHQLQARMQPHGLTPRELDRDRTGNWRLRLEGGQQLVLGPEEFTATLDRFLGMYGGLVGEKFNDVARIDTRYSNGIAIAWRSQSVAGHLQQRQGDRTP